MSNTAEEGLTSLSTDQALPKAEAPEGQFIRSSPWFSFVLNRVGGLASTFAVAVVMTFLIVQLIPGDPARSAAGQDATLDRVEQVRDQLGLNLPLWEQFVRYITNLFQGDLGTSFSLNVSVSEAVLTRLPFTAGLSLLALIVVLVLGMSAGISVGVLTRNGRRPWLGTLFGYTTAFLSAIPTYVMATLLVVVFALWLRLLPPAYSSGGDFGKALILPCAALSIASICVIARIVRRETAVVLEQDYMRTARGWRLGEMRTYVKYALPNLVTTSLTLAGIMLIGMLGGAISVELVFNWPGLGFGIVNAVANKDYPLIQGIVLVLSMLGALLTLIVDIALAAIDSRVRK